MDSFRLKATHKVVKDYYKEIHALSQIGVSHETAVKSAFANLLRYTARQFKWILIEEYGVKYNSHSIRVDGVIVDNFKLVHGFWEAKDTDDDLDKEVKKKFERGYPKNNIIFQAPEHVVIWQNSKEIFNDDILKPQYLVDALHIFYEYQPPAFDQWQKAIEEFKVKVPELASTLLELIEKERNTNKRFIESFKTFSELCQEAINPNLSVQAIEEMLIQHMLTERIFRKVFNNPDFAERNLIAQEIEKVIVALTSQYFSRHEFLKPLDRFYGAIETTASTIDDFSQKQGFLNTVYEKFFQGFSVKVADTHGIVYTPLPIVSFMVNSVEEILKKEFGRSLSDEEVHILDPFVGTGTFIVLAMQEIRKTKLPYKYADEIHCNEVMLLPYYIASMNIEHEYYRLTGEYKPFEGICMVDTFGLAEEKQRLLFTEDNIERVNRQKDSPIFVIIGNPPYNMGQVNENDNNKNRKYKVMDKRVQETYVKDSKATLRNKLSDPYVKAIRWASDRIGNEGIVAFVTNSSFINNKAFDGMRKHLEKDFDAIYIVDLGGNVRENPKLSGTTHNVFGIQVGVSINLFVKRISTQPKRQAKIYYAKTDELWRKEQKYSFLEENEYINNIEWKELIPNKNHIWLTEGIREDFETFIPLGTKEAKGSKRLDVKTIFKLFSCGVTTARDEWVYAFNADRLEDRVKMLIYNYNSEIVRFVQTDVVNNIDDFVNNDPRFIKWTDRLKDALKKQNKLSFNSIQVRNSLYRPFVKSFLYFDHLLNQRRYLQHRIFPTPETEVENRVLCLNTGFEKPFMCLLANTIANYIMCGGFGPPSQCLPF